MIEELFIELDEVWKTTKCEPINLHIIGSGALLLQMDYNRGTKDADIMEVKKLPSTVEQQLKTLAGKGSRLAKKHRLYIELVSPGLPFLPPKPIFHPVESLMHRINNFRISTLDPIDVVVSKLKTFRPTDVDDIRAVVDADLLDPEKLVDRFIKAKESWELDPRSQDLKQYIENLHTIQRDYLYTHETPIDLPGWIDAS